MTPPQDEHRTTLERLDVTPRREAKAPHAALVWALRYRSAALEADQLREALRTRPVIDQAKGILMAQHRCSADEAFDMLRQRSQVTNTKLREVAQALVDDVTR
ncbi:ANTAR domain-containing protein [Amycolatopsis sp. NPDC026612]|uniref:ANTAR domain-containing response regulator n=1 Tax=Amycolatopsis sp. NPDC026612 TaxID=3155466 RepID=UPI0033CEE394